MPTFGSKWVGLAVNDATPDVSGGEIFYTQNTAATDITDFDGGVEGKRILILVMDANTDFFNSDTVLRLLGGTDWDTPNIYDTIEFIFRAGVWYEVHRQVN